MVRGSGVIFTDWPSIGVCLPSKKRCNGFCSFSGWRASFLAQTCHRLILSAAGFLGFESLFDDRSRRLLLEAICSPVPPDRCRHRAVLLERFVEPRTFPPMPPRYLPATPDALRRTPTRKSTNQGLYILCSASSYIM
jgi:hypothetical protein